MASFWEQKRSNHLFHEEYRAIHECRCNPEYAIQHPNECKNNPECKVLTKCHPDAKERIYKLQEKILKYSNVPTVQRPKRFNRV